MSTPTQNIRKIDWLVLQFVEYGLITTFQWKNVKMNDVQSPQRHQKSIWKKQKIFERKNEPLSEMPLSPASDSSSTIDEC